ncbi:MAG TPA: sigma 54-interacting transcriptional regulator, partial [Gemmatimonadaceae bacterium]|nr:sigma 54-interacting transcriptional regulator [Gemmatimonadaceae bacterium]
QFAPLRTVFATAMAAANSDAPVLIVGAPGTGKCALARAIHTHSPRAARPFVQLDPAALAGNDLERTLYGAGRSDSASRARAVLATRGTLYLHEAAALSGRAQTRLARVLADGKFRAGDANGDRAVRARVIAATQFGSARSLTRIQPELTDVLGTTCIELPTLRERAVDIIPLAEAFLAIAGDAAAPQFEPDATAALHRYSWPGNIAELRAVVERARLLARDGVIRVTDLALSGDSALDLAEVERRHIRAVLEAKEWHQGRAAESLGIAPKTLYRKMREFGLQKPRREERA